MTALTWRNVDTPDFGSAITGVNNATKMLSNALESASSGLDKYKSLDAEAADRAIALRMLGYQDPAAYRQAIENGTIVGPDAARVSTNMLGAIDKRVGTLADQAFAAERADKFRYDSARSRDANTLLDAAQNDANLALRQSAAGLRDESMATINNSEAIANLRADQTEKLLTAAQNGFTTRTQQDTSLQNLEENRYDFGEKTSIDADQKAARDYFRERQPYVGSPEDAFTLRGALESDPNVNSRTLALYDSMMDEYLQRGIRGVSADTSGGGGAGGSSPSGSSAPLSMVYGGGQLPDSIQTVGDMVIKGKDILPRTADGKPRTPIGLYQITADTWADFAPKALGANWKQAPVRDFKTQDAVGKKIFESTGGDPAKLKARWASLSDADAKRISKMPWEQARDVISQGETSTNASQFAVISPTQTRNLQADSTTVSLLERGAQNRLGGITPEQYTTALQDTQSSDFDVANRLVSDESSPYFGADTGEVTEFIKSARERSGIGDNQVSPAVIGEILRRNAVQADNPLERGLSMLADIATGRFMQGKTRTPNIGSRGMRINDEAVYADIERARTGQLATQAEASRVMGANAQVLQAARDAFNRADSRYKAVLAASRGNPKLKASAENLKRQRDQAEAELARVNITVANTPELLPEHRETIQSNLNIPFKETDEGKRMREYMATPK